MNMCDMLLISSSFSHLNPLTCVTKIVVKKNRNGESKNKTKTKQVIIVRKICIEMFPGIHVAKIISSI